MRYLLILLLFLTGCMSNNQDPLLNYLYNRNLTDADGCVFFVTKKDHTRYVIQFDESQSTKYCEYTKIYKEYKQRKIK